MSERCGAERRRAKQGSVRRNHPGWWLRSVQCLVLCASLGAFGVAFAQKSGDSSDSAKPADSSDSSDSDGTPTTTAPKPSGPTVTPNPSFINGRPKPGFGIQASAGASGGDGVLQYRSLAPFEAVPYYIWDTSMIFSDVRVFPTVTGREGGNVGTGYRYYDYRLDRIFGVNLWYDADNTHPVGYFQQVGLGLESYGEYIDWRSNFYLPVGNTQQGSSAVLLPNSVRFSGNSILFDQSVNSFTAMRGLDMEAGLAIPGKFARDHGLRVYGGWYHFEGDNVKSFTGGKGRIQANIYSGLDASVQVMSDPFFQTRVFGALTWTFGPLHRSRLSQATVFGRIGERIQRNYTVVAPQQTYVQRGLEAVDPTTRQAYVVEHVSSSAAAGGDGTAANPFQTLAQAQAAGGNVIFVSANSVFNGADAAITLRPNEHLLGDGGGVTHFLQFAGVGAVALPAASGGALPVLNGSLGNAITLASGSQVSGFTINNPAGNGIYGNGITNASISNVTVTGAGNDGLLLQNASGAINVFNSTFANATNASMQVLGGAAAVNFSGALGNSAGYDLLVQNTTGGLVDISGGTITDNGGSGVYLNNNAGSVRIGSMSVSNGTGSGIHIDGGTGATSFLQAVNITNSAGPAVNIQNLGTGSSVTFSKDVTIAGRHAAGVLLNNDAGTTTFNGNVNVANPNNASASALAITNSSGNFNFNNTVNVTGATGSPGVNLVSNTGTTLFNTLNITSNGGTALFANNAGNLGINANGNIGRGVISSVNGTALDIRNTNLQAIFQSVSANGGTVGINMLTDTGYLTVEGNKAGTAGSGGTIQNMTTGVMLNNVGNVGLAFMDFDKNATAINSIKANHLELQTVSVTNSTQNAITALDTTTLIVNNSTFSGNTGATPTILATVDQVGSYAYSVTATQILTSNGDGIYVNSLPAGAGSTLNLALQNNDIENSGANEAGLRLNWAGPIVANIDHNQFISSAGSNAGVLINASSTTSLANIAITNNIFSSTGTAYTGLGVTAAGPSQIAVSGNSIGFAATGGTGMNFTLAGSNQLAITNNGIVDTTDGATGIFFNSITTPGSVQIDGNSIQLANSGGLIDRGIIFQGVTTSTASPTLSLIGNVNNVINGADTPFFIPLSTSTGQILVNGTPVP